MRIYVLLSPDPTALPEGMTAEDLAAAVEEPFRLAFTAAMSGLRKGNDRLALAAASAPVILHEAIHAAGVDLTGVQRWASEYILPDEIQVAAFWRKPITAHHTQVRFGITVPTSTSRATSWW